MIYASGHAHDYSRSVVRDDSELFFARIISGSSAYESYETRFGESVPAHIQRNGAYDPSYRTSACLCACVWAGGSRARRLDGRDQTFNRDDTRRRHERHARRLLRRLRCRDAVPLLLPV